MIIYTFIRRFGLVAALASVAATVSIGAHATGYPDRVVTIVVPQAPGGTNDIMARIVAEEFAKRLDNPFVVSNKPGAGGNIGTASTARSVGDGYTLLLTVSSAMTINPGLYPEANLGFDPTKDFAPVGSIASVPNVLVVNPSFPAKSLEELFALAKKEPGKHQYASSGNGTLPHLLGEMLNRSADISLQHIPYRGVAPALTDVMAGQLPMMFASLPSCVEYVKAGKLRALGVSSKDRNAILPDVPSVSETLDGFSGDLWAGLFAVEGTPPDVLEKLRSTLQDIVKSPAFKTRMAGLGAEVMTGSSDELARLTKDGLANWKRIIEEAGIKRG